MSPSEPSSVALITMIRHGDFPHAWSCLRPIESILRPDRRHFILLNDRRDDDLEEALSSRPHTTLLTPGLNLGVARGRNALIRAALDAGADFIFSLDDDLLVPTDYIDRVLDHVARLEESGHRVGIVGPAVLDYHAAEIHEPEMQRRVESGQLETFESTDETRGRLCRRWANELPTDVIYHMGVAGWEEHYMRASGPRADRMRSVARSVLGVGSSGQTEQGEVRRTDAATAVMSGEADAIPVDTLAGGVCAYRSDLIEQIGYLEEAFSPFGYEDAEFAIRASESGYDNFVLPSEILLHDLASRNKDREHSVVLVGLGKARALIARSQYRPSRALIWAAEALLGGLTQVGFALSSQRQGQPVPGHELLAGVLTYASGLVAGLFRPMSTRPEALLELGEGTHPGAAFQTRGGRVRYDRLVVRRLEFDDALTGGPPVALDADVAGIAVGLGGATALSGLPPTVKGTAGLTYRLDVSNREFHLDRLSIDLPGLVTIDLAFGLCSVGPGLPEPELSVADVGLTHLRVRIRDRGLVPRVESTVAWAQGFVGDGVLGAVSPSGDSELARALASWLGTSGPCDLEVSCRPSSPITVAHLESSGLRDLGLDVRFRRESTRSVHS